MIELDVLNQERKALIDDKHLKRVKSHFSELRYIQEQTQRSGSIVGRSNILMAKYEPRGKLIKLSRLIMDCIDDDGFDIDHKDNDIFNNQEYNLRKITHHENLQNVAKWICKPLTSRYKGVSWHKKGNKWQVHLCIRGVRYYGGLFDNEDDAGRQADNLMLLHQKYPRLNFPV
jgi:hypothetical protein